MAEAIMGFAKPNLHLRNSALLPTKLEANTFPRTLTNCWRSRWNTGLLQMLKNQLLQWRTYKVAYATFTCMTSYDGNRRRENTLCTVSTVEGHGQDKRREKSPLWRTNAIFDWPLMAVIVEHTAGQRDVVLHKSVWHLSDEAIKSVYTMYIMFTCWGCCFFGSTKDPFYDGEAYRQDGGDGTGYWVYEKQEDIEESARAELWREELIEEIEQKVGGLRELEEAGKKEEELVK